MEMHSLQINTSGPAMIFFTSFCNLPQKEQRGSLVSFLKIMAIHAIRLEAERWKDMSEGKGMRDGSIQLYLNFRFIPHPSALIP